MIAVFFVIALVLIVYASVWVVFHPRPSLVVENKTRDVPSNAELTDEDRAEIGHTRSKCFDDWYEGFAACAECTPTLEAWTQRREAAA
jgi:hypothetical protein